jgi:hypothetical protein
MLPIHSRGEVPRVFGIKGIADNNLPGPIGAALLEVIAICYLIIRMAGAASFFRTIRNFAIESERIPIKSPQSNLFMGRPLGGNRGRTKQRKKQHD